MSKRTKEAQKHLQQKREQYHRQEEKIEEMKCTMQHTEEEIKQLEYVLEVMKSAEKGRKGRVITHDKIKEYFASFSRFFDFLQHRLNLFVHYELVCEIIFARYRFRSRSRTPGREYLSFATVLTYFKNERSMVS